MNVLVTCRLYPGRANQYAGAETTQHEINRTLVERGHAVTVGLDPGVRGWTIDGVKVRAYERVRDGAYDLVMGYLDGTRNGQAYAAAHGVPYVHYAHNDRSIETCSLLVANSEWIAAAADSTPAAGRVIVCRPPVRMDRYGRAARAGSEITLANLMTEKGAGTFYALAEMLPEKRFLGVTGAWGVQHVEQRANVTILPNQRDMTSVYARTRILVAPSSYESWGRVATEALMSGIPVIAHPTPGLVENLGYAGLWCDRHHPAEYARVITCLDDPKEYAYHSALAFGRAEELDAQAVADQARLVAEVERLAGGG